MMEPELVCNLWAIYDANTGAVYALAGRAYNITGSDQEKLEILKRLSASDYVTAKRYKVPERFTITNFITGEEQSGVTYLNAMSDPNAILFEEMFTNLEADLPPLPDFSSEHPKSIKQKIPKDPLCVTTVLYESESGIIRPIITDEDRAWVGAQDEKIAAEYRDL